MLNQYYCLLAGLREYAMDSERKDFDALAIRAEVRENLSREDMDSLSLFYAYYDIGNILNIRNGGDQFNILGNFTRSELVEQLENPTELHPVIADTLALYDAPEDDDNISEETLPLGSPERVLYGAFYALCERSSCRYVRDWFGFDRNLRNICAAFTARRLGRDISSVLIGDDSITWSLIRSSAHDFGLKGEVDYVDQIVAALSDDSNLLDKERKQDMIRWNMSNELTTFDYFNINAVLAYLTKINIINRWNILDPATGSRMFDQLIGMLTDKELFK